MAHTDSTTPHDRPALCVELRIEPRPDYSCPVVDRTADIESVRINAAGDRCIADLTVADEADLIRTVGAQGQQGICRIFARHECVPRVRDVEDASVFVETYVSDRGIVRNLIASLESEIGRVSLAGLGPMIGIDETELARIDLSILTPKQREALELAVSEGYFDDGTTLEDLSGGLEISTSALSQRLRSAQVKLFQQVFES